MKVSNSIFRLPSKLLIWFLWRPQARRARILANFSAIEADSSWQLLQAYEQFTEAEIKLDLFCQAVEERHHALLFKNLVKNLVAQAPDIPLMERNAIVLRGREPWEWFAFCHAGESEAVQRFKRIADHIEDGPERKVLRRILRDEARHVHSAEEQADELQVDHGSFNRAAKRARRLRWKEAWMRQGKKITGVAAQVLLFLVYYILAPLGVLASRRRLLTATSHQDLGKDSASVLVIQKHSQQIYNTEAKFERATT